MSSMLVVTTPSDSEDLTVLATVKAELGINATASEADDNRLADMICQASTIIADWCNTTFGKAGYTETFFDPICSDKLVLARRPIISVGSVTWHAQTLALTDDYLIDKGKGELRLVAAGNLPSNWGWGPLDVEYVAGYPLLDAMPSSIERACIELVRDIWFGSMRDRGVASVSIPGVVDERYFQDRGASYDQTALPGIVVELLRPYRNFRR